MKELNQNSRYHLNKTPMFLSLFISLFLSACSSTDNGQTAQEFNYYGGNFDNSRIEKTIFKPITSVEMKKPLVSDHQLMMSLLNRPMTADQAMMLAYVKKQQEQLEQLNTQIIFVNYVTIKGDKKADSSERSSSGIYSSLINKDLNAINIMAPL